MNVKQTSPGKKEPFVKILRSYKNEILLGEHAVAARDFFDLISVEASRNPKA